MSLYPGSCPRCQGATELRHGIPVGQGEVVHDADILGCLNCGWERLLIANVPDAPPEEQPASSPRYWVGVGQHGAGPERSKWHRRFQWGKPKP